jgi:hypothetical protein
MPREYKQYIHVVIVDSLHMNIVFSKIYKDSHDDPSVSTI